MKILIADDHEALRRTVREVLNRLGCEVCGEAVDGWDAVAKAKELKPDVILMDIIMPKLNGLDATREIRRILPQTETLILTQDDSAETTRRAFDAAARGYIVKSAMATNLPEALNHIGRGEAFFDPTALATRRKDPMWRKARVEQRCQTL